MATKKGGGAAVAAQPRPSAEMTAVERLVALGDLSQLSSEERVTYYAKVCESLGLNPLTRPLEYLELDRKLVLYARKDCTEQLRKIHGVSVAIVARERVGEVYAVTARATARDGRQDESIGAVALTREDGEWCTAQSGKRYFKGNGRQIPLAGVDLANAIMKAETKAKRRVTLSVCGMGFLDETEVETIPLAHAEPAPPRDPPALPAPEPKAEPAPEPTPRQQAEEKVYVQLMDDLRRAVTPAALDAAAAEILTAAASRLVSPQQHESLKLAGEQRRQAIDEAAERRAIQAEPTTRQLRLKPLLRAKGCGWGEALAACGLPGEAMPDDLTPEEYKKVLQRLEALPDVKPANGRAR